MAIMNAGSILEAYRSTLKAAEGGTQGLDKIAGSAGFGSVLENVMGNTVESLRNAEQVGMAAVKGKASINDVVTALSAADTALQTIVTIRDRIMTAYQELARTAV